MALLAVTLAACGSDTEAAAPASTAAASVTSAAAGGAASVDLASVCPDPIVVQTDWFPSPEHGYLYSMIGDGGEVDADKGTYRGPLLGSNVDLEIRSGGPYLGYQPTASIMYQDDDILLGYLSTDAAVRARDQPTVAIMAPFIKNPQVLMWNPEQYRFSSFEDIGKSDATVLVYGSALFAKYLVDEGAIRQDQVDEGYDGSPSRFVADPKVVQQGFATSEPYTYEHTIEQFGKPVEYLVVADSGYDIYSQTLSAKAADVEPNAACFSELIPMVQQAEVDFYADPEPTSQVILDIVDELAASWTLDEGLMAHSARTSIEGGFVANGPDGVLGSMDATRMDEVTALLIPLTGVTADLDPASLYTNEFLDPSIKLPAR